MPLVHLIFFEDPRELTDEQVTEARLAGLLREDEPAEDAPEAVTPEPPADVTPPPVPPARPPAPPSTLPPAGGPAAPVPPIPGTTDRGTLTPP
jgi:hypothetical protein